MAGLQQSIQQIVNQQNSKIIKSDDLSSYNIDLANRFLFTVDEEGRYHSYNDEPAIVYMDTDIKIWMEHGKINDKIEAKYGVYSAKHGSSYASINKYNYIKGFRYCNAKRIYIQYYISNNKDLCLSLKLLFISNISNNSCLENRLISDFKYNDSIGIHDLKYINQKSKIIFNTIDYIKSVFINNDKHFSSCYNMFNREYNDKYDTEIYKYCREKNCMLMIFNNDIIEKFNLDFINKILLFITNFINTNKYIVDLCKINKIDKKDILNQWNYILNFENFQNLLNDIYYQECIYIFKKTGYKNIIMTTQSDNITLNNIKNEIIYNKDNIDNIYKVLVSNFEYNKINDYTLINFEKNANYLISNNYYIIKENETAINNNIISYYSYKCSKCNNLLDDIEIYSNHNVHRIYCSYCDDIFEYKYKYNSELE
jgi:hypothetical protein